MMKSGVLLFFILSLSTVVFSQQTIQGRVVDSENGGAIGNWNVFISNTSKGTVTDSLGNFVLGNIPPGKYELVVSCIGFETNVFAFSNEELPLQLKVELLSKAKELESVILEPYTEQPWDKWKGTFFQEFVGTGGNADQCKILNGNSIKLWLYEKSNRLIAEATEPILIENRALGYTISYQLEAFEINLNKRTTFFLGYPLFTELETGNTRKHGQWRGNRVDAYRGSVMHFMRSVYSNQLIQEGFEVKRMLKIAHAEKERIKRDYESRLVKSDKRGSVHGSAVEFGKSTAGLRKDTIAYYKHLMYQPDSVVVYDSTILTGDNLVTSEEGGFFKIARFGNSLLIVYKLDPADPRTARRWSSMQTLAGKEIIIGKNGNYYNSRDLVFTGYWTLTERVASMLPWDYEAGK